MLLNDANPFDKALSEMKSFGKFLLFCLMAHTTLVDISSKHFASLGIMYTLSMVNNNNSSKD